MDALLNIPSCESPMGCTLLTMMSQFTCWICTKRFMDHVGIFHGSTTGRETLPHGGWMISFLHGGCMVSFLLGYPSGRVNVTMLVSRSETIFDKSSECLSQQLRACDVWGVPVSRCHGSDGTGYGDAPRCYAQKSFGEGNHPLFGALVFMRHSRQCEDAHPNILTILML